MNDYYSVIEPYITNSASTCSYCDKLKPLIIFEGKNLYITAAIGAMVEGYVQICTKSHRTAATGLTDYERKELEIMKKIVFQSFKIIYGTRGIAFEHGQAGSCLWGEDYHKNFNNLCHHMHIHCLPADLDIHDKIAGVFNEYYIVNNVEDMLKIRTEILQAEQYLFFQDYKGTGYMYCVNDKPVPRQFLRKCVAECLGMAEKADWQQYPGIEYFESTISKMKPVITNLYKENANVC